MVDVLMGQIGEMGYLVCLGTDGLQTEESVGLCAQPKGAVLVFIHAIDGGTERGIALMHSAVRS